MANNQDNGGGAQTPGMGAQSQGMGMQPGASGDGQHGGGMLRSAAGMSRMGQFGMGGMEQNGEDVKAKLERHAKMKKYKERHDKAVEVFQRIAGMTVTTREGAIKTLAEIMARGNPKEKAEAIMAAGDFCWACNEEDAEKDVGEEVETLSRLMR